jgi:hypothetical protein
MLDIIFAGVFALGLVSLPDSKRQAVKARRLEALRILNISLTDAAQLMGMHLSDLSNALAGLNKLDDWRWQMLPDEWHRVYALLVLRDRGLPEFAETIVKIQDVLKERTADPVGTWLDRHVGNSRA